MKAYIQHVGILLALLMPLYGMAQTGTIRGKILEESTGDPLIGVTIQVLETGTGTSTDFDGAYELIVAPGTYSLQFSYISYQNITIKDVVVAAGKVTVLEDVVMSEASEQLEEVVVTAAAVRNSEAAVMLLKKKSAGVLDGISSSTFR